MTGLPPFNLEVITNLSERKDLLPRLRKLSLPEGHMRVVMNDPRTIAILARGKTGCVFGWSLWDDDRTPIISVFVHPSARHHGLGKLLRTSALTEGFKMGFTRCLWQDQSTRGFFVTTIDGTQV
jgi:GNAT superfamily N-acetyltransferase